MRTVKGTLPAWITSSYFDPRTIIDGGDTEIIQQLGYYCHDMTGQGWVRVGNAEITLTIEGQDAIIANNIDTLRAEQTSILAKAEAESNRIEGMIQQLLAIEYKP